MPLFRRLLLYLDVIRRLGLANVAYVAWYRFSLKSGLRKHFFPIRTFIEAGPFFHPAATSVPAEAAVRTTPACYFPEAWKASLMRDAGRIVQGALRYYACHWMPAGNFGAKKPLKSDLSCHARLVPASEGRLKTRDSRFRGNDDGGFSEQFPKGIAKALDSRTNPAGDCVGAAAVVDAAVLPAWFLNPFNGRVWPASQRHWTSLPDFDPTLGDIKHVWEASRFEWVVTLARAYAASGDGVYLDILNRWLGDWARQNPVNTGPNWKCGQEAAIRVFNLLLAANILKQAQRPSPALREFVYRHLERISANIHYAIAQDNNHGTSEAAALFIGGIWLAKIDTCSVDNLDSRLRGKEEEGAGIDKGESGRAEGVGGNVSVKSGTDDGKSVNDEEGRWKGRESHGIEEGIGNDRGDVNAHESGNGIPSRKRKRKVYDRFARQGRKWLENRIGKLVAEDGSFSQHSVTYHRVLLDTLIYAEFWRRQFDAAPFSDLFCRRAQVALDWLCAMTDLHSGNAPNLGSNDGALILHAHSCDYRDFRPSIQTAAALFRGRRLFPAGPWDEPGYWLGINASNNSRFSDLQDSLSHSSDCGHGRPGQLGNPGCRIESVMTIKEVFQEQRSSRKDLSLSGRDEARDGSSRGGAHVDLWGSGKHSRVLPGGYVIMEGAESWAMLRLPVFRFRPGHNDVFHFDLWHRGVNICRDDGSYSYHPEDIADEAYFGSVKAHNTICFDDDEQMPRLGRFLLGQWIAPEHVGEIVEEAPAGDGGCWRSWTCAYRDWRGNRHQRRVRWKENTWIVEDRLSGPFEKAIIRYRLAPGDCRLEGHAVLASWGRIEVAGSDLEVTLTYGMESLCYQHKQPVDTLVVKVVNVGKVCDAGFGAGDDSRCTTVSGAGGDHGFGARFPSDCGKAGETVSGSASGCRAVDDSGCRAITTRIFLAPRQAS